MVTRKEPIGAEELSALVVRVFTRRKMAEADAQRVADVLVWAEASGHGSHGVLRVPRYLHLAERGDLDVAAVPRLAVDGGALFTVDGKAAAGAVAMGLAVDEAARRAAEHGVAIGVVGATTHIGPAGYYGLKLVERGHVAIVAASGIPLMAYHGTATPAVSTAPLSIAVPAAGRPPIVLDMASSVAALGKIRQAAQEGRPIPEGWALTADGAPTTDPEAADVLLPLGGPKGAGLGLLLECLSSILAGVPVLAPALTGEATAVRQSAFIAAIDVARLRPPEAFAADVAALADAIEAQPRAHGVGEVLMPGARSARHRQDARANDLMIDSGLLAELRTLAG